MARRLPVAVLALFIVSCTQAPPSAPPPPDAAAARQALLDADRAWSETAKDVDRFVSFFAPDASFNAPGAPIATGTEAIRAAAKQMMAMPGFNVTWKAAQADVAASADLGYTRGTYELRFNDASGKPLVDRGKYVTVWKKNGAGEWKVVADIFNSDTPQPSSAT